MVHTATLIVHVFLAVGIIGLVLLQRGKGADAGTSFGAGASGTVFGARGAANFLSRTTAVLAALFFVTSLGLAWIGSQRTAPTSLLDQAQETEESVDSGVDAGMTEASGDGELPDLPSAVPVSVEEETDDLPVLDSILDETSEQSDAGEEESSGDE